MNRLKSLLPTLAAMLFAGALAYGANTTLWSSTSGDVVFPMTPTTIDGMTIGGTTPAAGTFSAITNRGLGVVNQGTPTAKTVSATLTAAEVRAGIITVNQAAGAASAQQLPTAAAMDTAFVGSVAGDSFDFSVINTSTVDAEDASITTNTGWTLVGSMDVHAYSAAGSLNSSARFRARKTAAGAWVLYRLA